MPSRSAAPAGFSFTAGSGFDAAAASASSRSALAAAALYARTTPKISKPLTACLSSAAAARRGPPGWGRPRLSACTRRAPGPGARSAGPRPPAPAQAPGGPTRAPPWPPAAASRPHPGVHHERGRLRELHIGPQPCQEPVLAAVDEPFPQRQDPQVGAHPDPALVPLPGVHLAAVRRRADRQVDGHLPGLQPRDLVQVGRRAVLV